MFDGIGRWLSRHDPEWFALHKAIKTAVVVTVGLAVGILVVGSTEMSTFASFGGIALLLFAEFPGGRTSRLGAYLATTVFGAVLIVLGTIISPIPWLAVASMAIVGFGILFLGILSAAAAGATRALLLAFILPVTFPGELSDVPLRLAGWLLAAALTIPLAVFVWPPKEHDLLRFRAADACTALARQLDARANPTGTSILDAANTESAAALLALRQQFRSTTFRPVGLTTGSRVLMRLTDRLEWLRSVVISIPPDDESQWPPRAHHLAVLSVEVLRACADLLADPAHRPSAAGRQRLDAALAELDRQRAQVAAFVRLVTTGTVEERPAAAAQFADSASDLPLLRPSMIHELAYTTHLAGETVAVSAAADARPMFDRLLGRHAPETVDGAVVAAQRILTGHATRQSVWFQNSIRGAIGLSLAVLLVQVTDVSHGFWVVLGAMSVLRSSAMNTRTTAIRALLGTLIGFLVGAALILLLGTTSWHLWLLLPFTVLIAAYLPAAVSFIAGQAAFTVLVVILFNIIQPVGWTVGLVRIQDIALGCAAGVVSGVLLWPRGAAAQIRSTLAETYRRSGRALVVATQALTGPPTDALDSAVDDAKAAASRVDDALREYLFERGGKTVRIDELTALLNGSGRLRLAAEAIAVMTQHPLPQPTTESAAGAAPPSNATTTPVAAGTLARAESLLIGSATVTSGWFDQLADVLDSKPARSAPSPLSAPTPATAEEQLLAAFRQHIDVLTDPVVALRARKLWGASLYLDDVSRSQTRLIPVVAKINTKPPASLDPAAASQPAAPVAAQ